ncbi:MAG: DEAD/DEAH box helicase [Mangrovibacterium sp.]
MDVKLSEQLYFQELLSVHRNPQTSSAEKVYKLRSCLEKLCIKLTQDDGLTFPNLFARLNYLCNRTQMSMHQKQLLHNFRVHANKVRHKNVETTKKDYLYSLKVLADSFECFLQDKMPQELRIIINEISLPQQKQQKKTLAIDTLRAVVVKLDCEQKILHVMPDSDQDVESLALKYDVQGQNAELTPSVEKLQAHDNIQLIRIFQDEDSMLVPEHIIFQPDYLLDVTSIARCFQQFQYTEIWAPELYFSARAQANQFSAAMHKGNICNLFFDELINASTDEPVDYNSILNHSFKTYPLTYTALGGEINAAYFSDLKTQFSNLNRVVQFDFSKGDHHPISRENATLETFFISPELGIQGRMDLFDESPSENNHYQSKIIELKSGKLPFPQTDPSKINEDHVAQARMYNMLVAQVLKHKSEKIFNAILYSSSPNEGEAIRAVSNFKSFERAITNVRNLIVQKEFAIANDQSPFPISLHLMQSIDQPIAQINKSNSRMNWFFEKFTNYKNILNNLSQIEQKYYFAFAAFITKEKILTKVGDGENTKGLSALWNKNDLCDLDEFNRLNNLRIIRNEADQTHATIILKRPETTDEFVNFRRGDIAVVYPEVPEKPLAVQHRILKCSIINISKEEVHIRLRQKQSHLDFFKLHEYWAIEHDVLDNSFEQMHNSLFQFLMHPPHKKELILGLSQPRKTDDEIVAKTQLELFAEGGNSNVESLKEQAHVLAKAWHAQDFFLMVGPPGTGKTNLFLHRLVKRLIAKTDSQILLVSFTNRAVDEICSSVREIVSDQMIRIGSALGCSRDHEDLLLEKKISKLSKRNEVSSLIENTRLFTGTLASINGKSELFALKKFDIIIVDEASQILEPDLIELLCRTERFVLIGDERQLPAVVVQSSQESKINDSCLNSIELVNRRDSYFERLLLLCKKNEWKWAWGELTFQGRMHPNVAKFSNELFYEGKLKAANLSHQLAELNRNCIIKTDLDFLLANQRMVFIPSEIDPLAKSDKSNSHEAKIVATLVESLSQMHQMNPDDIAARIGIITHYRNQVACIRQELETNKIYNFDKIQIDTVERFQGGQKDFIIVSMCVNSLSQLGFVTANRKYSPQLNTSNSPYLIDRKLNVTLTRARLQTIIIGHEPILKTDKLYAQLIKMIRSEN